MHICPPKYGYYTAGSKNKPLYSHPNVVIASLIKIKSNAYSMTHDNVTKSFIIKCLNPRMYPTNSFVCATYEFENWN